MQLKIKYFAILRDCTGKSEELLNTDLKTASELYNYLQDKYKLPLEQGELRVAINESFQDFNCHLKEMDTVTFIPPIAGG